MKHGTFDQFNICTVTVLKVLEKERIQELADVERVARSQLTLRKMSSKSTSVSYVSEAACLKMLKDWVG